MKRFSELEADEKWKAENCKLCPHCQHVVYKCVIHPPAAAAAAAAYPTCIQGAGSSPC